MSSSPIPPSPSAGGLSRKRFLQLAAGLPALFDGPRISAGGTAAATGAAPRRPNVLVLMTDQHRPDYLSVTGRSPVPTPHLDRIAARGVRFTRTYCPSPICVASRMALMTGCYPHTTGSIRNVDVLPWNRPTVADHFAGHGYHTALIGKMHFNDAHRHGFDYTLGFNDWFMYLGPKVHHYADECANFPTLPRYFNTIEDDGAGLPELPGVWGKRRPWDGQVKRIGLASELEADDHFEAFVARESSRFLERFQHEANEPFFLVASFLKPHPPFHPPRPWADRFPVDRMPLPAPADQGPYPRWIQRRIAGYRRFDDAPKREHRAGYWGNIAYVDSCIGEVYATLERLGLDRNTIVVYTSDHGEMDWDHGIFEKLCMFEPSAGVPLIVSHPGTLPENRTCDALTEYFGLFPTLSDLTGLPRPAQAMDARSFAPLVRDPGGRGPEAAFSEYNLRSREDCYMVRTDRYKYVYNHGDIPELYDLVADPGEHRNCGGDPALRKVLAEHHDRLVAWFDPAGNPYRPA